MYLPDNITILGAGRTGLSCIKFLADRVRQLELVDEKISSEKLSQLVEQYPNVSVLGHIEEANLKLTDLIILSPGINPNREELDMFKDKCIGDVELFLRFVDKPVVAITGTNGKSTVVTLVGEVLRQAGINVGVGGNLGTPCIELLSNKYDIYVLELSSFQLELIDSVSAEVACILNITPDHLERHLTMENYINIKRKIYKNTKHFVFNRDDELTNIPSAAKDANSFGLSTVFDSYSSGLSADHRFLMLGTERVLETDKLQILGMHNWSNLLAVITICSNFQVPLDIVRDTLVNFKGLPNRCQIVKKENGVVWINDSKATNVSSTKASIKGVANQRRSIILFLGGLSKGQQFFELQDPLSKYVKLIILFGRDAKLIAEQIQHDEMLFVADLGDGIKHAEEFATKEDIVLFAPGCSSFDMFNDYVDRGNQFTQLVQER